MSAVRGLSADKAATAQGEAPDVAATSLVVLGRIVGAWGIKGWLKVQPLADDPLSWKKLPKLWLCDSADGELSPRNAVGLLLLRVHGDGLVAQLDGVDDRDTAESLSGQFLGAPRDCLPETEEGEYYWGDLLGLSVVNPAGDCFGTVKDLLETGANDVLVVTAVDGAERLMPFVGDVVLKVDMARREITVAWELDW